MKLTKKLIKHLNDTENLIRKYKKWEETKKELIEYGCVVQTTGSGNIAVDVHVNNKQMLSFLFDGETGRFIGVERDDDQPENLKTVQIMDAIQRAFEAMETLQEKEYIK